MLILYGLWQGAYSVMYAQGMLNGQITDVEKEPTDKFVRIARMKNFLYICKSFEKTHCKCLSVSYYIGFFLGCVIVLRL